MKRLLSIKASREQEPKKLNYKEFESLGDDLADLLGRTSDTNIRDYLSEDELSQLAEASEILHDVAHLIANDRM